MSAWPPEPAREAVPVIDLENRQSGIQEFSFRHDDDIDTGFDAVVAKKLSHQPFGPIALHGPANLPRCCNSESREPVRVSQNEDRAVPTSDA
jgi:hypothetical protein